MRPVSTIVTVAVIVAYVLQKLGIVVANCNKSLIDELSRQFLHNSLKHLISNILGIYIISHLEVAVGLATFIQLLLASIILNVLIQHALNIKCGIGLSGVLFSLVVVYIFLQTNLITTIATIIILLIVAQVSGTNVSLSAHLIGVIVGLGLCLVFKDKLRKNKKLI